MEASSEHERYIKNPLRLLRCTVELASFALRSVERDVQVLPYNEINYPINYTVESPVGTEEELGYIISTTA